MNYFLYSFVTSMLILLQTSGIGGHGGIGGLGGIGGGTTVAACGTAPSWKYQFVAANQSSGSVTTGTTFTDSSGNAHTATVTTSGTVAINTTNPTPNGTKSFVGLFADTSALLSGTAIANATSVTICGSYNLSNADTDKTVLTASSTGSGAYGYVTAGNGNTAPGLDVTTTFNVAEATNSTPLDVWRTGCVVYTPSSNPVFYLSDGTTGAMVVNPIGASNTLSPSNTGIDTIFANWNGGGITEAFRGAVEELDIIDSALNSTQITTVGCLAKQNYGVN
jgi:hypothetical protein